ncbi:MAG TPA: class I SAM-dependent methyltransferase [Solirubrobacteraceae bacterium]
MSRLAKLWGKHVMAPMYEPIMWAGERAGMAARRAQLVSAAEGRTLELGAGTGLNVAYYPPAVRELVLSEPEPTMAARLRQRSLQSPVPTEVVEASAEELPFETGSFDTVICTFVLCTVRNPDIALGEAHRVLRDGGQLLFLEHVRAHEGSSLARWQDRLETPWRKFACGCRCNQDTVALLDGTAFQSVETEELRWRAMPTIVRPVVSGNAIAA